MSTTTSAAYAEDVADSEEEAEEVERPGWTRGPFSPDRLTHERVYWALGVLKLDFEAFVADLDTNERCPEAITLAYKRLDNAMRLWESLTGAWRQTHRA